MYTGLVKCPTKENRNSSQDLLQLALPSLIFLRLETLYSRGKAEGRAKEWFEDIVPTSENMNHM